MYILYAIMQTQLRKNIDAVHTYTNTAKEREKKEKAQQRQCGYLALLFCHSALTLAPAAACMSGRAKYCRSREG